MLLVQKYLETHSFKELQEQHGVYASFSKSGHKFSVNYDQIEAKESDPLSQETRGLILAAKDGRSFTSQAVTVNGRLNYDHITPGETAILAYPMKRFFNYGQGSAVTIDWADPNLAILEKLDGTLCIVYFDPFTHQWCVATRSVSEADLFMDNGIFTFRTLFEKALFDTVGLPFEEYASKLDNEITYCFELTTPYNRIVVYYPNNEVTLLSAREILYETDQWGEKCVSLEELDISIVDSFGVPKVKSYVHKTMDELVTWVSSLNPMEHEGVVIKTPLGRVKVKNAGYVAYNRVRDTLGASERNVVEIILAEKDDDVIPFLPDEIVKNLQKIKAGVQVAIRVHDEAYQKAKSQADAEKPGDKKTFAILVTQNKQLWTAPFFQMFDGKASNMKDFIAKSRKDGTWGNSFLDKMLELSKSLSP